MEVFSVDTVERLREQGHHVFVDFTADWCVTCKANEYLVINTAGVRDVMTQNNVIPVKADWTNKGCRNYSYVKKAWSGGCAVLPSCFQLK